LMRFWSIPHAAVLKYPSRTRRLRSKAPH
jgi:hypothetical protein